MESLSIDSAREMEERFAVTAATGALGPVLKKLAALLGDEYKLQEGTRRDIEYIESELEPVHHLTGKLWGRDEDLDVASKDWMAEARELSYDMEDSIDDFTLGLELMGDGSFIQRKATNNPFKEFMERVKDVSKRCGKMQKIGDTLCNRSKLTTDPRSLFLHKDASELVGMDEKKEELIELLQKHEMVCIVGFAGMGKTALADLVYQTIGDEFQCRAFVSVHPSPNMMEILGTILSQVTDGAMSSGSGIEHSAEQNIVNDISISLSEKSSGTEPAAEQHDFIKGISYFLSDKRYLVIIDAIWQWEEWEVICKSLSKNNLGRKLIMTTRVRSIAEKCRTEQGAHVYEQKFTRADAKRLSAMRLKSRSIEGMDTNKIADMCGGQLFDYCPLAVICLSLAWAESHHEGDDGEWDTWASRDLYDGLFLSTPSLRPLVRSLCLGFDHLPLQLRTCLLYCSIYYQEYWVDRGCMVRKWIAEGFVSQVEVADSYLEELVSRNLLQHHSCKYTVHPIMRAFLVCKAKQDSFIAYDDGPGGNSSSPAKQQIRRLSLSTDCCPDDGVLSHTRSLVFSGSRRMLDGVPFRAFKKLRVLEIHDSSRPENGHLVDICGLIWLKYLNLTGCYQITELPQEIGRLQNLEALYVRGTRIGKLPAEIGKLQRLEALDASSTHVMEQLPMEIGNLERLGTLDISWTRVRELPKEIWKLQHLRTLDIRSTMVRELPKEIKNLERLETLDISRTLVRELPKEIGKLQHLTTLDIRGTKVRELSCGIDRNWLLSVVVHIDGSGQKVKLPLGVSSSSGCEEVITSSSEAKCRDDLSIFVLFNNSGDDRCELRPVPMLRVDGRHMKVPQWVKQDLRNVCSLDIRLCKLVDEDLEFLKREMPNLQAIALRLEVLPREPVAIAAGGFSSLETFYVDCRLPRVVTFKPRAMPKLKHLQFKFYTGGSASQDYSMGITHLDSLEEVMFQCSEYYTSDSPGISAMIEAMRKEAAEHPNEITLYINDMRPEVFRSGEKWISQADRAIMQKESEEREHIEKQRRQLSVAAERRAEKNKKNNATGGTADVSR